MLYEIVHHLVDIPESNPVNSSSRSGYSNQIYTRMGSFKFSFPLKVTPSHTLVSGHLPACKT